MSLAPQSKIERCLYGEQIFARVDVQLPHPPSSKKNARATTTAVEDLQHQMENMRIKGGVQHKVETSEKMTDDIPKPDSSEHEEIMPSDDQNNYDPLFNPPPAAPQSSSILDVEENNGGGLASLGPRFKYSQADNVGVTKNPLREFNVNNFSIDYRKITHKIDIQELRRISSSGLPDNGSHRGVAWRVLLGYLPLDVSLWEATLKRERALYRSFLQELFVSHTPPPSNAVETDKDIEATAAEHDLKESTDNDDEDANAIAASHPLEITEATSPDQNAALQSTVPDHIREKLKRTGREALACINDDENFNQLQNDSKTNDWDTFIENAALLDEIRKDVIRTHPALSFFLEPEQNLGQRRYAALERILFVWAKLNKGVRYVQGMNEIIGTIFFVLATDTNDEWAAEAEADSYSLFNIIMVEMRDVFVPDMDDSDTGIQGRISNMMSLLSLHDPLLRCHLQEVGIDGSFYSIRWLTTLLSREFALPETIRVWDSMFASTHKENFLRYFCVTMLMAIREDLAVSDFGECLRLLQSYPNQNVDRLLESARALWIYESQITLACHKGGIQMNEALESVRPPSGIMMAYGLKGGIFLIQPTPSIEEKAMLQASKVMNTAHTTAVSYGRSFFGGANRLLNEWELKLARVQEQVQESKSRRILSASQSEHDSSINGDELLRPFGAVQNGGSNRTPPRYMSHFRRNSSGSSATSTSSNDLLRQFPSSSNGY